MSSYSSDYAREKAIDSLHTVLVHNPTSEDYIFWYDKYGDKPEKSIVPKAQKDIGFGKGNAQLPKYKAVMYAKAMIEGLITKIADKDWEEKKKQYRTRDETILHADKEAIRTNDARLWKELSPKIWLGIVKRYGGGDIPDPIEQNYTDSGDPFNDALKDLGIEDKEYEPTTESI